ncbi:hypothetical protein PCANC_02078 [Puccinia coronata f. sp. avenae]|uniref:Uncharacterized protein n=1 Tax=Puccinia coronata f. sp. avenae TaxID=200324 RepID=A0A2N5VZX9_9BASI|nr:hypothetical protein PCANC_02078 [Puccinia coronata f. sp. avenae]
MAHVVRAILTPSAKASSSPAARPKGVSTPIRTPKKTVCSRCTPLQKGVQRLHALPRRLHAFNRRATLPDRRAEPARLLAHVSLSIQEAYVSRAIGATVVPGTLIRVLWHPYKEYRSTLIRVLRYPYKGPLAHTGVQALHACLAGSHACTPIEGVQMACSMQPLHAFPKRRAAAAHQATDVTSVAQTDFMSAGPTDTLEQRHNVSVGAADVTLVW